MGNILAWQKNLNDLQNQANCFFEIHWVGFQLEKRRGIFLLVGSFKERGS